jgi:hypothetical protein
MITVRVIVLEKEKVALCSLCVDPFVEVVVVLLGIGF